MIQLPRTLANPPAGNNRFSHLIVLFLLLLVSFTFAEAKDKRPPANKSKKPARATEKNSRADQRRDKSRREERATNSRNKRDRDNKRDNKSALARNSRTDKRRDKAASSARERTARKDTRKEDRQNKRLSKRERLLEARRQAEQRRREIAEARRRAEIARQIALARQRAADQALRDEAAANIARDSTIGEDLEVRRAAVEALGNSAGTVVVMDPQSGRVYTVVNQDWAIRRGFKPCSTMKLVTGLAGLSEKVIEPVETVNVSGRSIGIGLTDALAYSVPNSYFQSVGGRVGFERMVGYARELGLGQPTGINHANEFAGRVPLFKSGYAVNHMSSHGDDFEVTPIQLATMVSAIANGGTLLVPHLPRTPEENVNFKREVRRKLNISQESLRRIVPGMIGAATYGSGRLAYDPVMTVAGKTGTCIGQGSWLGLFGSYAPVVSPRLAVVVVMRGSSSRGRIAAGIAGKIYRSLNGRFAQNNGQMLATTPDALKPKPKIDPSVAATLGTEESEAVSEAVESDATTTDAGATNANSNNTTSTNTTRSTVKTVAKPATTNQTQNQNQTQTTKPVTPPANQTNTNTDTRQRRVLTNQP